MKELFLSALKDTAYGTFVVLISLVIAVCAVCVAFAMAGRLTVVIG